MELPRDTTEDDFLSDDGLPISAMGMLTGSMESLGPFGRADANAELAACNLLLKGGRRVPSVVSRTPKSERELDAIADREIDSMLDRLEAGETVRCVCGEEWKARHGMYGRFWYCRNGHTVSRSSVKRRRANTVCKNRLTKDSDNPVPRKGTDMEIVAVKCDICGCLHEKDSDKYFSIQGNICLGSGGGVVGDNLDAKGKVVKVSTYCRPCLATLLGMSLSATR